MGVPRARWGTQKVCVVRMEVQEDAHILFRMSSVIRKLQAGDCALIMEVERDVHTRAGAVRELEEADCVLRMEGVVVSQKTNMGLHHLRHWLCKTSADIPVGVPVARRGTRRECAICMAGNHGARTRAVVRRH